MLVSRHQLRCSPPARAMKRSASACGTVSSAVPCTISQGASPPRRRQDVPFVVRGFDLVEEIVPAAGFAGARIHHSRNRAAPFEASSALHRFALRSRPRYQRIHLGPSAPNTEWTCRATRVSDLRTFHRSILRGGIVDENLEVLELARKVFGDASGWERFATARCHCQNEGVASSPLRASDFATREEAPVAKPLKP